MPVKKLSTAAISLLAFGFATSDVRAAAIFQTNLVRCSDTSFSPALGTCGGDLLTSGSIALSANRIVVNVKGALADPFNLYEVYWLPIGQTVTDSVLLYNFATGCTGATLSPKGVALKKITTGSDASSIAITGATNPFTTIANSSAGNFLVYSRGPWAQDTDGDCKADSYNTIISENDTDPTHELANLPVTLGVDEIQFISGFSNGKALGSLPSLPGSGLPGGTGTTGGNPTPPTGGTGGTGPTGGNPTPPGGNPTPPTGGTGGTGPTGGNPTPPTGGTGGTGMTGGSPTPPTGGTGGTGPTGGNPTPPAGGTGGTGTAGGNPTPPGGNPTPPTGGTGGTGPTGVNPTPPTGGTGGTT